MLGSAFITQLGLSIVVLAYGILLSRVIPTKIHWLTNGAFALVVLGIAHLIGLGIGELGLGITYIPKGVLIAAMASLALLIIAIGLAHLPLLHGYFLSQTSILKTKTSRILYETLFRIPLITALFEEFLFRGFLLALFLTYHQTGVAVVLSSLVFGLWHIFPAINGMNVNSYRRSNQNLTNKTAFVAATVMATALAGVVFCHLRIISNTIIAPWLLHWTINAGGVVAVLFAKKQSNKNLQ